MAQEKGQNLTVLSIDKKTRFMQRGEECENFITLRTFINSIGIFLDKK